MFKNVYFLALSENVPPPLANDNEQGPSGGGDWRKIDNIFIERKGDICYHVNRFLIVSLLSEIFLKY